MKNKQYYRFLRSSAPKPLQNCAVKFIVKNKRLDLKCFIQPDGCKQCWENCAAILINVGYPRNECVIDGMFEWLQDLNWPGAQQIKSYLPNLPKEVFLPHYEKAIICAIDSNDEDWLFFLHSFYIDLKLTPSDFKKKGIVEKLKYIQQNY